MKRFKHMISVTGTKTELQAFAAKLEKLGYKPDALKSEALGGTSDKTCGEWYSDDIVGLCTYPSLKEYAYHLNGPLANRDFRLPEQAEQALQTAKETISTPAYESN